MNDKLIQIYVTCPDWEAADMISDTLIIEKLIACSNCHESKSSYIWKDKMEKQSEIIVLAKSLKSRQEVIVRRITELHPYSIPCILISVWDANPSYLEWVGECLS